MGLNSLNDYLSNRTFGLNSGRMSRITFTLFSGSNSFVFPFKVRSQVTYRVHLVSESKIVLLTLSAKVDH